jgi:glycosyltransferase involved in cell wall biosynthesis
MRIGLVITIHNRPEYLKRTFESLKKSKLHNTTIYLVNDASFDKKTNKLFQEFYMPGVEIIREKNPIRKNMFYGLRKGWDYFYNNGYEILSNIDSDVDLKPHWQQKLIELYLKYPKRIITGFNTISGGRHAIVHEMPDCYYKNTIGGINMLFDRSLYDIVEPCLSHRNWDWQVCRAYDKYFIVSKPSVVQHIGFSSTQRHYDDVDVALDYEDNN